MLVFIKDYIIVFKIKYLAITSQDCGGCTVVSQQIE
jgi:hypothetical protein